MHRAPPGTVIRCVSGGAASAAGPSSATDATTNVHYLVLTVQLGLRIMVLISDLIPILPVKFQCTFSNKGYHLLKPKRSTARTIGDRAGTECKCLNVCFCLSLSFSIKHSSDRPHG